MARGLDGRFDKLPHARLSHSPHHAMVAFLTLKKASGRSCKTARRFFATKRHIRHKIS